MAINFEGDFKAATQGVVSKEQILGFVAGHDNLPIQRAPEAAPGQDYS